MLGMKGASLSGLFKSDRKNSDPQKTLLNQYIIVKSPFPVNIYRYSYDGATRRTRDDSGIITRLDLLTQEGSFLTVVLSIWIKIRPQAIQ